MAGSLLLARLPKQRFDGTISPLHATAHLSVPPCLFLHADTQVLANWTVMFSDLHEKPVVLSLSSSTYENNHLS